MEQHITAQHAATQTYTFYISGMHCPSCVVLTESELGEVPGVTKVESALSQGTVTVTGKFGNTTREALLSALQVALQPYGYGVSIEKPAMAEHRAEVNAVIRRELLVGAICAAVFAALFISLQKMGLVSLISAKHVTYGTAFFVGVIASLSSCMAVVGGLVLSLSATAAKEESAKNVRLSQLAFHAGRIISFFVLGGVIGALGAIVSVSTNVVAGIGIGIGLVMLVLGINLLEIFPAAKRFQFSMPKSVAKYALAASNVPFLIGVATFFLPCGFTQSMQLYALGTGSFLKGALTMLAFALGTLPVLAFVSMSSLSIGKSRYAGVFFKAAGFVVILFAIFNIINSLVVLGAISPVFNF